MFCSVCQKEIEPIQINDRYYCSECNNFTLVKDGFIASACIRKQRRIVHIQMNKLFKKNIITQKQFYKKITKELSIKHISQANTFQEIKKIKKIINKLMVA